ncbi:MAG: radical SAM protein [Elusimicrobia bacterium]|nr:radical SAM protein [Elusimicrobiota bacterium]
MKILFVIKEEDPIDPMNIELLSALAKRDGHETFLNVLEHRDLMSDLRRIEPHGGPHPTFNHRGIRLYGESLDELSARGDSGRGARRQGHVIVERSDLDALCVGEGDDAWVEVLTALDKKNSLDDIPNIVTRTNRRKYPLPLLRDRRVSLDDLPFLDRRLVYDKTFLGAFPLRSLMAGRGCPFRCTYCFNHDWNRLYLHGGKLKKLHNRYSVDRLIAEITAWRRLEADRGYAQTQFIKFYDDIFEFTVSPWLVEFAEKFPKEVGLPFFCLIRCDILARENSDGSIKLNEEVLLLLKKAGMQTVSMSIEAGNRFIRENIFVRDMTEKEIRAAFALVNKHKIATFANTILGVPAPVIPNCGKPDFDAQLLDALFKTKAAFVVSKRQVERGYPTELDSIADNLQKCPTDQLRQRAVALLEGLGLKRDPIAYDIESVEINIQCGIHHTMFPRLDPYPGTVMTDYTAAIGAFDGDFEKLHSSYDTTSSFSCFTKRQKMIQDNLSFLGQICAAMPWLWPFAKKYLIYWPLTKLYWFIFLIVKTYVVKRYIYPMRFNFGNAARSAYRIMLVEYKKFFQNNLKSTDQTTGEFR